MEKNPENIKPFLSESTILGTIHSKVVDGEPVIVTYCKVPRCHVKLPKMDQIFCMEHWGMLLPQYRDQLLVCYTAGQWAKFLLIKQEWNEMVQKSVQYLVHVAGSTTNTTTGGPKHGPTR